MFKNVLERAVSCLVILDQFTNGIYFHRPKRSYNKSSCCFVLVAILVKVYAVEYPSLHSGKYLLTIEPLNKSVVTGKLT